MYRSKESLENTQLALKIMQGLGSHTARLNRTDFSVQTECRKPNRNFLDKNKSKRTEMIELRRNRTE